MKTTSELAFEKFLSENGLPFEKIEEQESRRPDYLVTVNGAEMFVEVKEIAEDENFKTAPVEVHHRIMGDHVRSKIYEARGQIQFGKRQGIPSVLLIYNNLDPVRLFGTEDSDFIAAMYGEYTVRIDVETMEAVDFYNGRNRCLEEEKNTSFSALARLYPVRGKLEITLFENIYAKVKLPYDLLPTCFDVKRVTRAA